MNYSQSLRYLNSFLNFEKISFQKNNRNWNLQRMKLLLDWFDHPERHFFPIIIAGTKGKGSTGFFLESILTAAGILTGFYHSPHLEEPTERIRVQAREISTRDWTREVDLVRRCLRGRTLSANLGEFTYFEILTLMAMLYFARKKVKAGIFEVGMGGRLDATNILQAPLALITSIGMDHEAVLGPTLRHIAREKAAVIHEGACVVTGPQPAEAMNEIRKRVKEKRAFFIKAAPVSAQTRLGLRGDYQRINAGIAVQAAQILNSRFTFPVSSQAVAHGLKVSGWKGRWELLKCKPAVLLDAAHNPPSCEALVRNLKRYFSRRDRVLIFGVSRDKKYEKMLSLLSGFFDKIVLVSGLSPRSREIHTLLVAARPYFKTIVPSASVKDALEYGKSLLNPGGILVAAGSFYLAGEVRRLLSKQTKE